MRSIIGSLVSDCEWDIFFYERVVIGFVGNFEEFGLQSLGFRYLVILD